MSLRVLNISGPAGGPSFAPRPGNLRLDSSTASARHLPASLSMFRTTRPAPRGSRRRGSALGPGGARRQRPLPAGSPGRRRRSPGVCVGGQGVGDRVLFVGSMQSDIIAALHSIQGASSCRFKPAEFTGLAPVLGDHHSRSLASFILFVNNNFIPGWRWRCEIYMKIGHCVLVSET